MLCLGTANLMVVFDSHRILMNLTVQPAVFGRFSEGLVGCLWPPFFSGLPLQV